MSPTWPAFFLPVVCASGTLPADIWRQPAVAHAMKLRAALALRNYYSFFTLYTGTRSSACSTFEQSVTVVFLLTECPHQGTALASKLLPYVRFEALMVMHRAYRPANVDVAFLCRQMRFASLEDCRRFVTSCGAVLSADGDSLVTTSGQLKQPSAKDSAVEDEAADRSVTHSIV